MAIAGVPRSIDLSLNRMCVLVSLSSNYTRGLMFSDGSQLKIFGYCQNGSVSSVPGENYLQDGLHEQPIGYKLSANFQITSTMSLSEINEYLDQSLTLFFVDPVKLKMLNGYVSSAIDFTSIKGALGATILNEVKLIPSKTWNQNEVTVTDFSVGKFMPSIDSSLYEFDFTGTNKMHWDWDASNSLVDSISSVTLTNNGASYVTSGYDFVAGTDYMDTSSFSEFSARNVVFVELWLRSDLNSRRALVNCLGTLVSEGFSGWAISFRDVDLSIDIGNGTTTDRQVVTVATNPAIKISIGLDFNAKRGMVYDRSNLSYTSIILEGGTPEPVENDILIGRQYIGSAQYYDGFVKQLGVSVS